MTIHEFGNRGGRAYLHVSPDGYIAGDTYSVKEWLKYNYSVKWDNEKKAWKLKDDDEIGKFLKMIMDIPKGIDRSCKSEYTFINPIELMGI